MKKLLQIIIVFLLGFLFSGAKSEVFAADCSVYGITISGNVDNTAFQVGDQNNSIFFTISNIANEEYSLNFVGDLDGGSSEYAQFQVVGSGGTITFSTDDANLFQAGSWSISLTGTGTGDIVSGSCSLASYDVEGAKCGQISVYQDRSDVGEGPACFGGSSGGCLDTSHDIFIKSETFFGPSNEPFIGTIIQDMNPGGSEQGANDVSGLLTRNHGTLDPGSYTVIIRQDATLASNPELCRISFDVSINCNIQENACVEEEPIVTGPPPMSAGQETFSLCKQIPNAPEFDAQRDACILCTEGTIDEEGNKGVWTAVGCIKRDPKSVMQKLISIGLGMSGGVALLTFLAAGFIFSTSQGDPKAYGKAKDMMTSSIIGLLFVIFSITILQFIGFSILKIPGFGG